MGNDVILNDIIQIWHFCMVLQLSFNVCMYIHIPNDQIFMSLLRKEDNASQFIVKKISKHFFFLCVFMIFPLCLGFSLK